MTNVQQAQMVHTKSPHSTGPPQPQRPTPSPFMRPSSQTPNISPLTLDLPSSSQTDAAITHTESNVTAPTHKEILLSPTLFDTFISDLDHELSNPPPSKTPIPFPKLAHTSIAYSVELFVCSLQPLVPSIKQTDTLPTDHTITSDPTHTPDLPKIPDTITTPTYHFETEKKEALHGTVHSEILQGTVHDTMHDTLQNENLHGTVQGTWRRLGPIRDLMNSTTSNESVLRSKRKQQSLASCDDPLTDKKQKLLDMEAKALD